jgi:hypothetical protein
VEALRPSACAVFNAVVESCQNAGLHVVAAVCDMGSNSIKETETVRCYQKKSVLQVSELRNCNNM